MTNDLKLKVDHSAVPEITTDERRQASLTVVARVAGLIGPAPDGTPADTAREIRDAARDVLETLGLLDVCPKHGHEPSSVCGRCKNASKAGRERSEILARQAAAGGAS